jgi:hypothetical protein
MRHARPVQWRSDQAAGEHMLNVLRSLVPILATLYAQLDENTP